MNFKKILSALLVIASSQAIAQHTAGLETLPGGVQYKIFTANTTPKIKVNDVITFNMIQRTDKDSVLYSSYTAGRPGKLQVQAAQNNLDLMAFLPLLTARDSAIFKVPADSIFKGAPDSERPPFLKKGSYLSVTVKVEKVQSMDEAMAEYKTEMEKMKATETEALTKYLTDQKLNPAKTTSGLRYIITKPSIKPKAVKGDSVWVNYVGSTLDGKVFDSSIESEAKKAGLEQPGRTYEPIKLVLGQGQVIPGWEEGLLLLNEGAKATFIIPSELAYGPQGSPPAIMPFSTLRFDLELVKVKKPKKVVASPAKKPGTTTKKTTTPVKKTTTPAKKPATPAKKPAATTKPKTK
ncbi:FKBP-type peptidyl-prolyl cis-trans isomerase [Desertivirga arenae]|uniref:FKBP-type peptidyl-prolyl cis-trans isomerase n=1 Tax=Desertivirga arenae TaxID=2810309 RepID=UPI001A965EC5|nr:FKBP-type peptidyl-prolyl cis-trans isomerase [Pedobacter sp. SYSU D00823]